MPIKKQARTRTDQGAIVRIQRDDLKPGRLATLFQSGVKAVILCEDERVSQLWNGLFGTKSDDTASAQHDKFPWQSSILTTAENHRAGEMRLGDMLRFIPGMYAHIARKTIVYQKSKQQSLQALPDGFWNGDKWIPLSPEVVQTAWELMSCILKSTWLDGPESPRYAVAIEQLKYPNSSADLDKMFNLLADSGGAWTRLGHKLDAYKAVATGPFDTKIVRDLFAWMSLIPGVHTLLHRGNDFLRTFSCKQILGNMRMIGDPHVDGSKILTALVSDRDVLITEIYDGKRWLELPLSPDALAIFPSKRVSTIPLGVPPTLHRVLMRQKRHDSELPRANVTLSLCVVERPSVT